MTAASVRAESLNTIHVPSIEQVEAKAEPAVIETITGEMTREGQKDTYKLTVPADGRVRLEMAELYGYAKVGLYVYDRLGECVHKAPVCGNGDGLTLKNLKAGEVYDIEVRQYDKLSKYHLLIGMPKANVIITEVTSIQDAIEFTDQRNTYTLDVIRDGRVRLEFAEMMADVSVTLKVFNRLGEEVAGSYVSSNKDGVTLTGLQAGETYSVVVYYYKGFGDYTLLIGKQKEYIACEPGTMIEDSIEHTDQRNVYSLTANTDGDIKFELGNIESGKAVRMRIFNRLKEKLYDSGYMENGDTCVLKNVQAGQTYQVQILYSKGFCDYQLTIR